MRKCDCLPDLEGRDLTAQNVMEFYKETEIPGIRISQDNYEIICHRYYFASRHILGKDVIEIGCGPGIGLGYMSKKAKKIIGIDIDQKNLKLAKDQYGDKIELLNADAHKLPFESNSFDVVICMASIIYLDLPIFINECKRVLRRGGMLIFNTPNRDSPKFNKSILGKNYLSVPELSKLFNSGGYKVELFGAFHIDEKSVTVSPIKKIRNMGIYIINKLPNSRGIVMFIRKFRSRNFPIILKSELNDEDIESVKGIPIDRISTETLDLTHRIIYGIAKVIEVKKTR